jgi:hypothetical protein
MLRIDIHHWFAMAAVFNPKWPPKYKNPPIWAKLAIILNFINSPKATTHYGGYSYNFS